jgi:hypothetical protein
MTHSNLPNVKLTALHVAYIINIVQNIKDPQKGNHKIFHFNWYL